MKDSKKKSKHYNLREYQGLHQIDGPLIVVKGIHEVGFNEIAEIETQTGERRMGLVLESSPGMAVVQVFEGTTGISLNSTRVRFLGSSLKIPVTQGMLGRIFNGIGHPIDGGAQPISDIQRDINGAPINPIAREYPNKCIITGFSAIDGMNTLIRGQKLPIFSGNGLPHNQIAAQIIRQATVLDGEKNFAIVFSAMGIKYDTANYFIQNLKETGALENTTLFLNLANDPPIQRLITPRTALTFAEHLAFDLGMHVLVILSDMTNYCESLREISTIRGDIPSRKGYPGYLYSNLASIYERAGIIKGGTGSITQIPILTMPNDDITHPIPDLTGFITEGQIVLDRELWQKGIYPPIAGLPSLSRLMKDGIGKDLTRDDHPHLASQLFAAYSKVKEIRALASVIGEEELTPLDARYMEFGEFFEKTFLSQRSDENRDITTTLDKGWEVLSSLPREELHRVTDKEIQAHYGADQWQNLK